MDVHVAGLALEALVQQAVQQRAAVITEGGRGEGVQGKVVLRPRVTGPAMLVGTRRSILLLQARTLEGDKLVAPLVHHIRADLC